MEGTCLFTPGVAGSCRGLILLSSQEGHSPFSSHDGHRVVLKSGKTQPINYSRGQRGQSLAWNWARSYQSAGASEGDICLWDSLTLSTSHSVCRFSFPLHFSPFFFLFSPSPSFFFLTLRLSLNNLSVPPFLVRTCLNNLCSLSFISLCLLIFSLCLCEQPHTPPRPPAQTLFHGSPSPLFTHSLTSSVFQHLSNSPSLSPSPSPSLSLPVLSSLSFYALLHHLPLQRYVLVYLLSNQQDRIKP